MDEMLKSPLSTEIALLATLGVGLWTNKKTGTVHIMARYWNGIDDMRREVFTRMLHDLRKEQVTA